MDTQAFQRDFLREIDGAWGIDGLFSYLPEVQLFVKNRESRFVKVNPANLRLLGKADEREVIGKTDLDFFSPAVAKRYIEEDRMVMESGEPFVNQIWLVPNSEGLLKWYLCTKIPLRNREGKVIGIAGTLIDYTIAGAVLDPYQEMAEVIRYLNAHFSEEVSLKKLAELAHVSVSQFERRFKQMFQITPKTYLMKLRLNAACKRLSQTNQSVANIAVQTGFYDHSYFTKMFKKSLGVTPRQYRRDYFRPRG